MDDYIILAAVAAFVGMALLWLLAPAQAMRLVDYRRDKHATDQLRRLRQKVKNLQGELVRMRLASARRHQRLTYWNARATRAEAALKRVEASLARGIEDSTLRQENIWYRERMAYIADRLESFRPGSREDLQEAGRYYGRLARSALDYPLVPFDTSEGEPPQNGGAP